MRKQYERIYKLVPARLVLSAIPFMTMAIRPERASGILLFIAVADGLGSWAMGYL